jgi:hypothetical protein
MGERAAHLYARWIRRGGLWLVWVAATALGGLATPLAFLIYAHVDAWLNPQASPTAGVEILILVVPFAAAAVAALPQGLVLRSRGARV